MARKGKARKTIALIAHDGKKAEVVAFALAHVEVLERYALVATNTTGKLLGENTRLKVRRLLSGPLGGDAQIALPGRGRQRGGRRFLRRSPGQAPA